MAGNQSMKAQTLYDFWPAKNLVNLCDFTTWKILYICWVFIYLV